MGVRGAGTSSLGLLFRRAATVECGGVLYRRNISQPLDFASAMSPEREFSRLQIASLEFNIQYHDIHHSLSL
jgi:hypothetical protein